MNKLTITLLLATAYLTSFAQCSAVSVQVSSSDTNLVQLYQAGFFLIPNGNANVCHWEVSDLAGNIIHQDTTSGAFNSQSFSLFNHNVPLTDSMRVVLEINNAIEGITCTAIDTLFWEETEVLPGSFIGAWAVLNSDGGVVTSVASDMNYAKELVFIYPSLVDEYFLLSGNSTARSLRIVDINGKEQIVINNVQATEHVYVPYLSAGLYFAQLLDANNNVTGISKFVKQ